MVLSKSSRRASSRSCADNGNRTHIICVEDREFTINPYPHMYKQFFLKRSSAKYIYIYVFLKVFLTKENVLDCKKRCFFAKRIYIMLHSILEGTKGFYAYFLMVSSFSNSVSGNIFRSLFSKGALRVKKERILRSNIFNTGRKRVFACLFWQEQSPDCFRMRVNRLRERSQGKCYSAFYGMKCVRCVHLMRKNPILSKTSRCTSL